MPANALKVFVGGAVRQPNYTLYFVYEKGTDRIMGFIKRAKGTSDESHPWQVYESGNLATGKAAKLVMNVWRPSDFMRMLAKGETKDDDMQGKLPDAKGFAIRHFGKGA
jgi:hypothetical protein